MSELRQNKDLIESLNEVYQMCTAFSHELETLRTDLENTKEDSAERLLQLNNTILETSANLNKRMRVYQSAQESIIQGLSDLATFKEEMEKLKETNRIMQMRMTNFKNDMIALQSHIINAPELTDDIEIHDTLPPPLPTTQTTSSKDESKYARLLNPRALS